MNVQEKNAYFERYNNQIFLFGRIMLTIAAFLLLSVPILIGIINETTLDISGILSAIAKVGIIYIPVGIVEFLVYSPMLGVSGSFLSFLTGNVTNLKIPCVMNAKDIAKVEEGSPESEIISSISVATSSIVTMVVIAIGVALLVPLTPILQNATLIPAFDNVVPALFGALALKYFIKEPKIAVIPLTFMILLCVAIPALIPETSMLMLPAGGLALLIGYLLWKNNKLN